MRERFEAELRRFLWFSAMIETLGCLECLERREVSNQYWHGGGSVVRNTFKKICLFSLDVVVKKLSFERIRITTK